MMVEKIGFEGVFYTEGIKRGTREYSQLTTKITGDTKVVAKGLNLIKGSFTEVSSAMNIANQVMRAGAQLYGATVTKFYDLAMSVKKYGDMSGMTYEDISRLISITGDLDVNMTSVAQAFKTMSNEGISPTIENLAKISDKYLSLNTAEDRNKYANDALGKSYQDMIPILTLGSIKIKELAGNVNEAQIVTSSGVTQALAYRDAMNEWNDSVSVLTNTLGSKFIPVATGFLNIINEFAKGPTGGFGQESFLEVIKDLSLLSIPNSQFAGSYGEGLLKIGEEAGVAEKKINAVTYALTALGEAQIGTKQIEALNAALEKGTITQDEYTKAAVPIMKNQLGMSDNAIAGSMAIAKLDDEYDKGKLTLAEYNKKMTDVSKILGTAGDKGKITSRSVDQLNDSIYESKWAAEKAYPKMEDLMSLFVTKNITWSLFIRISGGEFTEEQIFDLLGEPPPGRPIWNCFVGNTLVNIPKGFRKIKDICIGDTVITYDEKTKEFKHGKVIDTMSSIRADLLTVKIWNRKIHCSPNHRFYTTRGWVEAQNLLSDDKVLVMDYGFIPVKVSRYLGIHRVYNFTVEDYHTYLVYNCIVHNKKFAGGGFPAVGRPAIVGENGPEMIVPRVPIQVIPNNQLPVYSRPNIFGMGGGLMGNTSNINNNWNFQLSTMSGPNVIQRSYEATRLINQ